MTRALLLRFKVTFRFDGNLILPIHYNSLLQAFIYSNIKDKSLQTHYHEKGFQAGNKKFKLFTFSRITGNFIIDGAKGIIQFTSPVSLTISSVEDAFLSAFLEEVVVSKNLYLNGKKIEVENFESVIPKWFSTDVQIEMLSPITVYKTEFTGGKKYMRYFSPWENDFGKLVSSNLMEKYNVVNSSKIFGTQCISLTPMFDEDLRFQKVIKFKTTVIKGWMGTFRLQGQIELIKQAYYAGLGAKNSEGFGCFKIFGSGEH